MATDDDDDDDDDDDRGDDDDVTSIYEAPPRATETAMPHSEEREVKQK